MVGSPRKVIVVDDQSVGRLVLSSVITNNFKDVIVSVFSSALFVPEYLRSHDASLLVTDYSMPEMNGLELVKAVRKTAINKDIPIVMISLLTKKEVRSEAESLGVLDFISRPLSQKKCIDIFGKYLN